MPGIPTALYTQIREGLMDCGPFGSNEQLRAVFAHPKLRPWRNSVPEASNRSDRVDRALAELSERRNTEGENALVLFLQVSSDRHDKETECHHRLKEMAQRLDRSLGDGLTASPVKPASPQQAPPDEVIVAEIEALVREDKLMEAIEKLIDLEVQRDNATLLARRLERTQNRERQGMVTSLQADTEYNRIAQAILNLLRE